METDGMYEVLNPRGIELLKDGIDICEKFGVAFMLGRLYTPWVIATGKFTVLNRRGGSICEAKKSHVN